MSKYHGIIIVCGGSKFVDFVSYPYPLNFMSLQKFNKKLYCLALCYCNKPVIPMSLLKFDNPLKLAPMNKNAESTVPSPCSCSLDSSQTGTCIKLFMGEVSQVWLVRAGKVWMPTLVPTPDSWEDSWTPTWWWSLVESMVGEDIFRLLCSS